MTKKVSCRKAFSAELLECARTNRDIVVITSDSGGTVTTTQFAEQLPNQFVEVGIAEQNAVGVAAGLALAGKNAFVCGPACFVAARSFEQVKVDVAYNKTNVKIVGVSAGVSYGPLGGTHISLHDLAQMRVLPNMQIFVPADAAQTRFITRYLSSHQGPAYIRMGRGDVEEVYGQDETFEIGKAKRLCEGTDATLITCGEMVYPARQACKLLQSMGIQVRLLDLFTIKPIDEAAIFAAAHETGAIITLEEHSVIGGLGEAVAHILCEQHPTRLKIMGFPDEPTPVGNSAGLFAHYGFTPEGIASSIQKFLGK